MPLDIITDVVVTPRGGPIGTQVTVTGSGFGIFVGKVIFDPLDEAVEAIVTSWVDNQVVFTVPTTLISNGFTRVTVERLDQSDSETFPFWLPATSYSYIGALPSGLDYQWPLIEEGDEENTDDPRTATAADFNRAFDRMLSAAAGALNLGGGVGLFAQNNAGVLEFKSLQAGAGISLTPSADEVAIAATGSSGLTNISNLGGGAGVFAQLNGTVAELRSIVGAGGASVAVVGNTIEVSTSPTSPTIDLFGSATANPITGQTLTLSGAPAVVADTEMIINGTHYTYGTHFTVSGTTLTWLGPFSLETDDLIEVRYTE